MEVQHLFWAGSRIARGSSSKLCTCLHKLFCSFYSRYNSFYVQVPVHRKYIPIYIQQYATLHSLFISGNCSTCFGWYLHPSSGAHTTVSTASGICHTVTAICRYRGRVGTGLSELWVAYALIVKKC
jgi:hypothetical protein